MPCHMENDVVLRWDVNQVSSYIYACAKQAGYVGKATVQFVKLLMHVLVKGSAFTAIMKAKNFGRVIWAPERGNGAQLPEAVHYIRIE